MLLSDGKIKKIPHQVLFLRTLKKTFPLISILMSTHQRKKSFNDQKIENKDNINKLNDINIKLFFNNNFPNKCKTVNDNLDIVNKINNNPIKIKVIIKSIMRVVMFVTIMKLMIKK